MNIFSKTLSGCRYGSNKVNLLRRLHDNCSNVRRYCLSTGIRDEFMREDTRCRWFSHPISQMSTAPRTDVKSCNNDGYIERYEETSMENKYIREYLENSIFHRMSIVPQKVVEIYVPEAEVNELLHTDWNSKSLEETFKALRRLAYNVLNNKNPPDDYYGILDTLKNRSNSLSVQELKETLLCLQLLSKVLKSFEPYVLLIKHIGLLLKKCLSSMSTDEKLLTLDYFYKCQFFDNNFPWYAVRHLGSRVHRLTGKQLVQFLFYVNVFRNSSVVNMFEVELHLQSCLSELSLNEIGIVLLCLFKCKTGIRNTELYKAILMRTAKEIGNLHPVCLTGIMKILRLNTHHVNLQLLEDLFNAMVPLISKGPIEVLTHVIHVMTKYPYFHRDIVNIIMNRVENEVSTQRLKDIESIIILMSLFNMPPSECGLYQKIIDELTNTMHTTRKAEIDKFAYCLLDIVCYLSYVNVYPVELIQYVMQPEFVKKIRNGRLYKLRLEHFILECNLRIENPDYKGPFLLPSIVDYYFKKCTLFEEKNTDETTTENYVKLTNAEKFLLEVIFVLKRMFNITELPIIRTLPHFYTKDIVFGIDENKNIIIPDQNFFFDNMANCINYVNRHNGRIKWIACVLGNMNSVIHQKVDPENELYKYNVYIHTKLRQLKLLGYEPILVCQTEWDNKNNKLCRQIYLRQKLLKCL